MIIVNNFTNTAKNDSSLQNFLFNLLILTWTTDDSRRPFSWAWGDGESPCYGIVPLGWSFLLPQPTACAIKMSAVLQVQMKCEFRLVNLMSH